MRSRQVIGLLIEHGWYEVAVKGSHHQFKRPERPGRVTVPTQGQTCQRARSIVF
jgi:predicted RNA binding protein YcfA (HicA-like mRNA interferase family)